MFIKTLVLYKRLQVRKKLSSKQFKHFKNLFDMKTIVRNVLTSDEMIFVNDSSLVDNMVNAVIHIEKKTSNLLNDNLRKKIITDNNLTEHTSKLTGRTFVYCEKYDLIAHAEK